MSDSLPEPSGYVELLELRVRALRDREARAASSELLALYRSVGRDTLDRQEQGGWGSRVIDRLATDLRAIETEHRKRTDAFLYGPGSRQTRPSGRACGGEPDSGVRSDLSGAAPRVGTEQDLAARERDSLGRHVG